MRFVPDVAALAGLGMVLFGAWTLHRSVGFAVTGVLLVWVAESMDRGGE